MLSKFYSIFFFLFVNIVTSYEISGTLKNAENCEIILNGFNGFEQFNLAFSRTDSLGNFKIIYPKEYIGSALFIVKGKSSFLLILKRENISFSWSNLKDVNTIKFILSFENDFFLKGSNLYNEVEEKIAGLNYLCKLYANNNKKRKWLFNEKNYQEKRYNHFVNSLPDSLLVKNYLNLRKFVSDMQLTNERYKEAERLVNHENQINKVKFNSNELWHSGLLEQLIFNYYKLFDTHDESIKIEKINLLNSIWLNDKTIDSNRMIQLAKFCFMQLEKLSLNSSSEFIALNLLNQDNIQLPESLLALFEQYRKIAVGKEGSNIFDIPYKNSFIDLKTIKNKYKLLVFGSSECGKCQNDYPSLVGIYKKVRESIDIEIIYISLDETKENFDNFFKDAPFLTYCDFKSWDSQIVKDYYITATPTYILLDSDLVIQAKLNLPEDLINWLK